MEPSWKSLSLNSVWFVLGIKGMVREIQEPNLGVV